MSFILCWGWTCPSGRWRSEYLSIECPIETVDLTFTLLEDLELSMPCANTPAGWITFEFHEDLDEACFIALKGMLDLIKRQEAYTLASLTVDMRIPQIVNQMKGVMPYFHTIHF
ncbi:hypothetical protein AB1K84_02745 [Mesobacillus foraminis]|uniref:hypothetical protein n=1 Tax=Mesobacillus foraminis TaxID=279826 RepID=UPI0039A15ADB